MRLLIHSVICVSVCIVLVYSKDKVPLEEISKAFSEMDIDGDGKVTREETIKYMETKKTSEEANHYVLADSIFDFYDKNVDGHLTLQEFLPHDEL